MHYLLISELFIPELSDLLLAGLPASQLHLLNHSPTLKQSSPSASVTSRFPSPLSLLFLSLLCGFDRLYLIFGLLKHPQIPFQVIILLPLNLLPR